MPYAARARLVELAPISSYRPLMVGVWGRGLVVGGLLFLAMAPSRAEACSFVCTDAGFFPARGTVPANLSAVLFWPARGAGDPSDTELRFVEAKPSGPVDVPFALEPVDERDPARDGYRVVPRDGFKEGARYALWSHSCGQALPTEPPTVPDAPSGGSNMPRGRFALFDVAEAAPLPDNLGAIQVSAAKRETLPLADLKGGCADSYAVVSVDAELAVASPWADAIAFETYVDGELYGPSDVLVASPAYGSSWVGRARDKLIAICGSTESVAFKALSTGTHTLQFRGTVPGTPISLTSEETSLQLPSCDSADAGAPFSGEVLYERPRLPMCSVATLRSTRGVGTWDAALAGLVALLAARRSRARP